MVFLLNSKHDHTNKLLLQIDKSSDDPDFYRHVFSLISQETFSSTAQKHSFEFILDDFDEMSLRFDRSQIQDSSSARNILRTRQIAELLIDESGELQLSLLNSLVIFLEKNLYSIGPGRQEDAVRQEHLLNVLKALANRSDFVQMIKKVSRPLFNPRAEEIIRLTLQIPSSTPLTDKHARQAVLSAWMSYLRQNVGSCFATAPAQLIHDEQYEQFLIDLIDLIGTGKLKRVVEGIECSVPLSASFGSGDLKKRFRVELTHDKISPEIHLSPGLIAAFESVGLFHGLSLKEQIKLTESWIHAILENQSDAGFCILTTEELIHLILLQSVGLTEAQFIELEENWVKEPVQPQRYALNFENENKKEKGLKERFQLFKSYFETAKNVFKSFTENALLKSWEYTLASFSEAKFEFTKWNLYSSLGLKTEESGGIGHCIYQTIQHKLDIVNQRVQELQYEYEAIFTQVKTLESRMKHTSTEQELQWIKMEYQSRANELHFMQEQYENSKTQATALKNLYDTLYRLYVHLFSEYFQEVYDADMQDVTTGIFDDSPAGFRLLYKHGRSHTSQWTLIKDQHEFIEALVSFFTSTESQILHELEKENIERDLGDVVTAIVTHVKTRDFLESALQRMAAAHKTTLIKNPLENLDRIDKKPWVYTSGGKMTTLIHCYFKLSKEPTIVEKWVESEIELLVYIADTLKAISPKLLEPYKNKEKVSLLMQSPTHAFRLQPFRYPFQQAWENDSFTYTYVRDQFVLPAELFVDHLILDQEMINLLVEAIFLKVSENFRPRFKERSKELRAPLTTVLFRDALVEMFYTDRGLQYRGRPILNLDEVDSLLYSSVPFMSKGKIAESLKKVFDLLSDLTETEKEQMVAIYQEKSKWTGFSAIPADQFQQICKALICLVKGKTFFPYNYHLEIARACQKLGFAMPTPLIFADSNWMKYMFGFVVSPGTGRLELWRLDSTGSEGYPMSSWKEWVDGSRPDIKWGIFVKPYEYDVRGY